MINGSNCDRISGILTEPLNPCDGAWKKIVQ